MKDDDFLNRPVRSSDYFVIITGFVLNIASAIDALAEDFHQLSVYHSNQKTYETKVWQDFAQDLETLKEE